MTKLPDIGTIVKLIDNSGPPVRAVVVPPEYHARGPGDYGRDMVFTRLLEGPRDGRSASRADLHGGWWVGRSGYSYKVIPDEEVSDEILALAGRCLLDPTFIPEIEE